MANVCSNRGTCAFERTSIDLVSGKHDVYTFPCACNVPDDERLTYSGDQCEIATYDGEDVCLNGGSIMYEYFDENIF